MRRAPAPSALARGFTLLEILIVLGVILILASLVLGIGSAVIRGAERAQLEAAMETVDKAMGEWESTTGRQLSFVGRVWTGSAVSIDPLFNTDALVQRFDVREADAGATGTGTPYPGGLSVAGQALARAQGAGVYCINLLAQTDFTKEQVATISSALLRAEPTTTTWPYSNIGTYRPSFRSVNSRTELVDPWGKRVAFIFPGRQFRWGVDSGIPDEDGTIKTSTEQQLGSCVGRRICLVSAGPDGQFGPEASTAANRAAVAADNISLYPLLPPNGN